MRRVLDTILFHNKIIWRRQRLFLLYSKADYKYLLRLKIIVLQWNGVKKILKNIRLNVKMLRI